MLTRCSVHLQPSSWHAALAYWDSLIILDHWKMLNDRFAMYRERPSNAVSFRSRRHFICSCISLSLHAAATAHSCTRSMCSVQRAVRPVAAAAYTVVLCASALCVHPAHELSQGIVLHRSGCLGHGLDRPRDFYFMWWEMSGPHWTIRPFGNSILFKWVWDMSFTFHVAVCWLTIELPGTQLAENMYACLMCYTPCVGIMQNWAKTTTWTAAVLRIRNPH